MIMPTPQTCPVCHQKFMGSDAVGDPCPDCQSSGVEVVHELNGHRLEPNVDDQVPTRQQRWDRDYLALARWWADRKSKDPSTRVGAVLVREDRTVISMGYNGFPRGVSDDPARYAEREVKYKLVSHAEMNALNDAGRLEPGTTLYCTMFPCNECAKSIIQRGVDRVVSPPPELARWDDAHQFARLMFEEAGVEVWWYPDGGA